MRVKNYSRLLLAFLLAAALLMLGAGWRKSATIGQAITLAAGSTSYTTTAYSTAYLAGNANQIRLHGAAVVSGTGNITITAQFSDQPVGCGSVTSWYDAVLYTTYAQQTVSQSSTSTVTATKSSTTTQTVTTTTSASNSVSFGTPTEVSINPTLVISGDATGGRVIDVSGACVRLKFESDATGTTFTPTAYGRLTW